MRISHFITLDKGTGPVSLLEFEADGAVTMIRVTHGARFDRVRQVDAAAARRQVGVSEDLGTASTRVDPAHARLLGDEALQWAHGLGCRKQGLRWGHDGVAVLFATEVAAVAWESAQDETAPVVARRRKMIMG